MTNGIPVLELAWPWNANHRYQLYLMDRAMAFRGFLSVWFSNRDASVYLMPLYDKEYSIRSVDGDISLTHEPGADFHLSLHESGVVKLTTSSGQVRLREPVTIQQDPTHVVTLQVNCLENFPEASLQEINASTGRRFNLPMASFPQWPTMISIFATSDPANWVLPRLGDTFIVDCRSDLMNQIYGFHFLQWQKRGMSRSAGDIALRYTTELEDELA